MSRLNLSLTCNRPYREILVGYGRKGRPVTAGKSDSVGDKTWTLIRDGYLHEEVTGLVRTISLTEEGFEAVKDKLGHADISSILAFTGGFW